VFVVGCSLQLRAFSPARPLAVRARRLALVAVAMAALVAGVALSARLTEQAATPMEHAASATHEVRR
jgi:hypothetical protein